MDPHFVLFGAAHKIAIALAFVVPPALALVVRMSKSPALVNAVRWLFAAELIATYILWYWLLIARGWAGAGNILPMHLCDWATIAVVVTLLSPNQRSYELAYFWALAGTLLTTVTPDLQYDFPDWRFVFFFFYHATIITSVFYMTFALGMRPVAGSIRRVILWTLSYVAVAGTADVLLGTDYGFLRAKPAAATLFDAMSPWPWYIAECFAIAIAAMLILYAPFYLAGRVRSLGAQGVR
jgi:hypothetical integral membrane protein (TIGR02206 family)